MSKWGQKTTRTTTHRGASEANGPLAYGTPTDDTRSGVPSPNAASPGTEKAPLFPSHLVAGLKSASAAGEGERAPADDGGEVARMMERAESGHMAETSAKAEVSDGPSWRVCAGPTCCFHASQSCPGPTCCSMRPYGHVPFVGHLSQGRAGCRLRGP